MDSSPTQQHAEFSEESSDRIRALRLRTLKSTVFRNSSVIVLIFRVLSRC